MGPAEVHSEAKHELGQKGYLRTERGRGGGLSLARPAEEICIGAVVAPWRYGLERMEAVYVTAR